MDAPLSVPQTTSGAPAQDARTQLRREISAASEWAYFDHAAVSPIPRCSADAMRHFLEQAETSGDFCWPQWSATASHLRILASDLIHCESEEIALVPNTTFGINVVANAYPWSSCKNPNVVVLENEFPSNLLPWWELQKRGVEIRMVSVDPTGIVDLDRLREAIDASTRIVSVSWVGYASGYRLDLEKICAIAKSKGAKVFLDAIQGLGVFPCDVSNLPIDYLAADGHKWMLGPEGAGILYIRKDELEVLEPMMLGWNSLASAHLFRSEDRKLKRDASRYEGGSANHVGQIGMEASLRLLLELGANQTKSPVATAVLENAAVIEESLRRSGATIYRDCRLAQQKGSLLSGIISFSFPDWDPLTLRQALIRHKVMLSVRHGRLRIATHAYNDTSDIERLSHTIDHFKKRGLHE